MNKYNPNIHHRRSIRLKGYDYSQEGLYFITICIKNRACLFGNIERTANPRGCPIMILNDAGKMVDAEWNKLPQRFPNIQLHEYIVMPNHFHAIIEIVGATLVVAQNTVAQNKSEPINTEKGQPQGIAPNEKGQPQGIAPNEKGQPQGIAPTGKNKRLGDIIGAFESITTVEYIRGVKTKNWKPFNGKLWQRNYWEHIIRNEQSYNRISEYIFNNPKNWKNDKLYGEE
ncbi:MAG: transposase [Cyclobacteriaceae bacterium]